MLSTIKYFISAICIFLSFSVTHGQEKKIKKPQKINYKPTGIRVGTDLIDLGKTFTGKTFKGWEINGDMAFSKYYFAVDVGTWAKDLLLNNGIYNNSGNYYRVGIDINFLDNDPDKNMFFLGFRVGRSQFNESLSYQATSTSLFSPAQIQTSNGNVRGGWGEITTGLRVKIWKGFWMGYTARLKLSPTTKGSNPTMAPYDMPGYGIIQNNPWWGFNYQLFWRFAWKKDVVIPIKN
jgi:hypothetical protein